jgi:hypothetical protein
MDVLPAPQCLALSCRFAVRSGYQAGDVGHGICE